MSRAPSTPVRGPRTAPGRGNQGLRLPEEYLNPTRSPTQFGVPSPTPGIEGLPFYDDVPIDDPMYEGQPVPQGQRFRVGQVRGQCVITRPRTQGRKRSSQRVVIEGQAQFIAVNAYRLGFNAGYASAQSPMDQRRHCVRIRTFVRWIDGQFERARLSQDPDWPRKKSKTGLTRTGRRRRGPG